MEKGTEIEADVQSFTDAADRMEKMFHIVQFAAEMKIKQQTDALFEGMSSSARSAIENSQGLLDVNKLARLLKEISEKDPSDVIKILDTYNRDDIESIKNQLEEVENTIKKNAIKQKEISDMLSKKIKKIIQDLTKKRLNPTKRQRTLDHYKETSRQQADRESTSKEEGSKKLKVQVTFDSEVSVKSTLKSEEIT